MANRMIGRLPANVELDDLIQVGMIGLNDALCRFDGTQGVRFETFAYTRIRGAMIDELRRSDWMSRAHRRDHRSIDATVSRLEQRYCRPPRESEVAREMGLSLPEYRDLLFSVRGTDLVYLEDIGFDEDFLDTHVVGGADPFQRLHDRSMRERLVRAVQTLPEREKQVMDMYYESSMTLREIASVFGVTESRICQLHARAVRRLRETLCDWR
jgi:RNA polymerase sigma factor for flagellar operon FliA